MWQRHGMDIDFINFNNLANTHAQSVIETPKEGAFPTAAGMMMRRFAHTEAYRTLIIEDYHPERADPVQVQLSMNQEGTALILNLLNRSKESGEAVLDLTAFPVADGRFAVAGGKAKDIPYMAGSTSHDMAPPILHRMTRKWISDRKAPGYTWFFDRMLPGDDNGAWHSSDLWYWFGTLDNCWRPMEEKDRTLSEQMVRYLCNFVQCGDPNRGEPVPRWAPSTGNSKSVLCLGEQETAMRRPSLLNMIRIMLTNKAVGE